MAHVSKEQSQALSQVRLKADILSLETVHKLWVLPCKAAQVSEIDIQSLLFFSFQGLCKALVITNLGIRLVIQVCVCLIVRVLRTQHKPAQKSQRDQSENSPRDQD